MTHLEKALDIVVTDIRRDLDGYYRDWDITSWAQYLEDSGRTSADFKEDVLYMFIDHDNTEYDATGKTPAQWWTDDGEIVTEDGHIISYRKFMNMVRKQIKEFN